MPDSVEPGTVDYRLDFYVKDFIASTLTMSGPEAAAYQYSLSVAWIQGASLPADPEKIRRAMRYDQDEWARVWPALEEKWPLSPDGKRRVNRRLAREWARAKDRAAAARRDGKHGAQVRWGQKPSNPAPAAAPDRVANSKAIAVPVSVLSTNSSPKGKNLSTSEEGVGAATSSLAPPAGPVFKVVGNGSSSWRADLDLVADLKRLYPSVNVEREMDLAASKIKRGVVSPKTAKGMARFLHTWMGKEQNRAHGSGLAQPDTVDAVERERQNKRVLAEAREKMRAQGLHPDDD